MTYRSFELAIAERVAHLKLSRPDEMNAMNAAFFTEIAAAAAALHEKAPARALVISSTGKHFTAGMALDVFSGTSLAMPRTAAERAGFREVIVALQQAFTALERLRMPVIAVIQGGCIGGGVDMVAACDIWRRISARCSACRSSFPRASCASTPTVAAACPRRAPASWGS